MIVYNDISNKQYDVFLETYPSITTSNEQTTLHSIVGRNGSLIEQTGMRDNIAITCTFAIRGLFYMNKIRELKKWLSGQGKLSIEDETLFYNVQLIEYGEIERTTTSFGRFTVTFHCSPYEYIATGQTFITPGTTLNNPYDKCSPIYKIVGEGMCVLNVNGYELEMNVGQDITIDTELMLAYRTDEILNTSVKGDYDQLKLNPGNNTISITRGFNLTMAPRWGYQL